MTFDKELIEKYLNGECTAAELDAVTSFLRLPEGEKTLKEVMDDRLPQDMTTFRSDLPSEQEALKWIQKLHTRIAPDDVRPIQLIKRFPFMRYAAMFGGAMLFAWLCFLGVDHFQNSKLQQLAVSERTMIDVINPKGRRCTITLSDGTVVSLGADSRLSYPKTFSEHSREISLQGEAFFKVQKNPGKPFIVHTRDIQTRVLGTSFKINAFRGKPLSVAVATGLVRVDQFKHGKLFKALAMLNPGKKVSWDSILGTSSITDEAIPDITGWVESRLAFNAETLQEIATQLERSYDVEIDFSKARIAYKRVTITLTANLPLNNIMQTLSLGSGFKYKIKGKKINIY